MDLNSPKKAMATPAQDVKTHEFMSITPEKRKENAGPLLDAKRRVVKTEGDCEVYTSFDKGKAICSDDDDEELSDISDDDVDTLETGKMEDGEEFKYMQRNGDVVEFSYFTECGDFTALKKALEKFAVRGSRPYKKRFRLIKEVQQEHEQDVEHNPQFRGYLIMEVDCTKKGHLCMANSKFPSLKEIMEKKYIG